MAAHDEFALKQNNPCFIGLGSVGASQSLHFDRCSVESLNESNHRVSKHPEQAVPSGSLALERLQQQPFTVDPDEQKCTIPQIVSDAMVLKHVGDKTGQEVFISKFDMAFFFDQFVLVIQERWKNFRFLRVVPELVELSQLSKQKWVGMHQAHQRLGFGGRRNSKIAQRFAHLFVWVVDMCGGAGLKGDI